MQKIYKKVMKERKWIKIFIVICLIFSLYNLEETKNKVYANEASKAKNISIVFDNSSSMFFHDKDKIYVTRWIEADYAVRALRNMMGAKDEFKIYFIGDKGKLFYEDVNQGMEEMRFHHKTEFDAVKMAVNEMSSSDNSNSFDNWVIILTDGKFTEGMETRDLKQELKNILEEKNVSIFYIPIGDGTSITESPQERIFTIDGKSNDITEQILEAIKKIYNKEQIVSGEEEGVYIENGKCCVDLKIPLDELNVFVQEIGEEQLYDRWKTQNEQQGLEMVDAVNNEKISYPEYLILESTMQIRGRNSIPKAEPEVKNYDEEKIKYKELQGTIYRFKKGITGGENEYNKKIEIPVGSKVTKAVVYYQPDIEFQLTYTQDGNKVIPWKDDNIQKTENSNTESFGFVREGSLKLKLECVDSAGQVLESPLLSSDKFIISYQKENEKEKVVEKNANDDVFLMDVTEGKYKLKITTPWHTTEIYEMEVLERKKEISMQITGQQKINVEGKGGIHLEVLEEGVAVTDEDDVSITVNCDVEEIEIKEPAVYLEEGKWLINYNYNKKAELPEDKVLFKVCVVHDYNGEIQKKEEEFYLHLSEEPFEIKTEQKEVLKECSWAQLIPFVEDKIPLDYIKITETGERILLSDSEYRWLEFGLENIGSTELEEYILIDEKGKLKLKGNSLWGEVQSQDVKLKIRYVYSRKQSAPLTGVIDLMLTIEKIATWKLILFWTIINGVVLWIILLAVCKIFIRSWHIPAMIAGIKIQSINRKINIRVKRGKNCLLPFWRTATLVYKYPKRSMNPYIDNDFSIKFRRISTEEVFEIVNYEDFSDKNKFRLNNLQIGSGNNIFSKKSKIMICDKNNIWREIELDIGKR